MNNPKIILFKGTIPILNAETDYIAAGLRNIGVETLVVDLNVPNAVSDNIPGFIKEGNTVVLSLNNLGMNLEEAGSNFWKKNGIPFITWLMDHPRNYDMYLMDPICDLFVIVPDGNHVEFINRFYPKVSGVKQILNGGVACNDEIKPFDERKYEVIYMASLMTSDGRFPVIQGLPDGGRDMMQSTIGIMLGNTDLTTEDAIASYFRIKNIAVSDDQLFEIYTTVSAQIESLIRAETRIQGIKALDKAGVRVDIWGSGWEPTRSLFTENVTFHGPCAPEMVPHIINDSKITMCYSPWFKDGCTDKQFDALLNGSLCLSDRTAYLEKNYKQNENIELFSLKDNCSMAQRAVYLLDHSNEAESIIKNGHEYAKEHETWTDRAVQVIEMINDLM